MLGIDVSKDTLVCTLLDPQTQKPIWNRTVPNTAAGINRLLRQTPQDAPWALEPTGRYSLLAATAAHPAGRNVLLAQPKKARDFLRLIQSRAKTDTLDSHGIGLFALCCPLPAYPLKSIAVEQLDQLLSVRKSISASLAAFGLQAKELSHAAPALEPVVAALQAQMLYLAAQANLKATNSPFKDQYERERAKGLSSTAALCAVARKLARLAWSLHKHGHPYDPQRVYQQNQPHNT